MTIEAYWMSGSPYGWRVLLALEIKQLEYQSILLEYSQGDLKTDAFLKMNPKGKVPVLRDKDGDIVICESVAILAYLESKYPNIPLFGKTPGDTGLIWQHVMEYENVVHGSFYNVFWPLWCGEAESKAKQIKTHAQLAHKNLSKMENNLAKTNYIIGDTLSAADIVIFPAIQCLLNALSREDSRKLELEFLPLENNYPLISKWINRIASLPGYANTYPPHWSE